MQYAARIAWDGNEMTVRPLRVTFGFTSGPLIRAWVIPAMAFLAVMAVASFRFLVSLPRRSRALFIATGAIYIGGALGLEMGGGVYTSTYLRDLTYGVLATFEEVLEMTGMVVFLYGLMDPRNATHRRLGFTSSPSRIFGRLRRKHETSQLIATRTQKKTGSSP